MRQSEAALHHVGMKIYLPVSTHRKLKAEAALRGTSMSALVAELINKELSKGGAK